jgi:hypothetical protein
MTRSRDVANIDGLLTTKGDIYAATAAATPSRIGVGANATVLTADSAEATGMKWAASAAGGMTEIASGSLTGASVILGSIPATYKSLRLVLNNFFGVSNAGLEFIITGITANYFSYVTFNTNGTTGVDTGSGSYFSYFKENQSNSSNNNYAVIDFPNYAETTSRKMFLGQASFINAGSTRTVANLTATNASFAAITSLTLQLSTGNWSGGTYILFGVK